MDLITGGILNLFTATAAATAVVWLSKAWIGERLKRAIEHEYAQKIEVFKAELSTQHAQAIETLRVDFARHDAVREIAAASFSASHGAAQERILRATERLWSAVLTIRSGTPQAVTFSDILTREEWKRTPHDPRSVPFFQALTLEAIQKSSRLTSDTEAVRPFVGEYAWALFYVYRALLGRIAFLLWDGWTRKQMVFWLEDPGIQELLATVLTPEEQRHLNQQQIQAIAQMRGLVEKKILVQIGKVISGESSADLGFQQALDIQMKVAALEKLTNKQPS